MTAINIRVEPERALVWSDGLQYHPDGTVAGFIRKAVRIKGWNAVVLVTGLSIAGDMLADRLPRLAPSFDAFRADREFLFGQAMTEVQEAIDRSDYPRLAAFIVGWSDAENEPELIVYTDLEGNGSGKMTTRTELVAPRLTDEEQDTVLRTLRQDAIATGRKPNLTDAARMTMEVQRRHRANPEFTSDGYYVGGHITETVIDAHGIRERIIHRWNDRVGEKIAAPAALAGNVVAIGSRADRRRAEKLARKNHAA